MIINKWISKGKLYLESRFKGKISNLMKIEDVSDWDDGVICIHTPTGAFTRNREEFPELKKGSIARMISGGCSHIEKFEDRTGTDDAKIFEWNVTEEWF